MITSFPKKPWPTFVVSGFILLRHGQKDKLIFIIRTWFKLLKQLQKVQNPQVILMKRYEVVTVAATQDDTLFSIEF